MPGTCSAAKERGEPKLPSRVVLQVVCGSSAQLELCVEREFKLTRSAVVALSAAATLTTDGTDRLDVAAGVTRSDVVEGVEGIHAELDGDVLPYGERFGQSEVGPKKSGPR
jgi:hypothetical protein